MRKLLLFIAVTVVFASCASLKVETPVPLRRVEQIEKIALFPVMIGQLKQPTFPLIDAGIFNNKTNKIADRIMDAQKITVDKYRDFIARSLEGRLRWTVLFGDSLQALEEYQNLAKTHNFREALMIKNNNFPIVITSNGDFNPFRFSNGDVVKYFKQPNDYRPTIQHICKELNIDAMAVSFSNLRVTGVSMFGGRGKLRIETFFYLFDKNGNLIGNSNVYSKPISIRGSEVGDYQVVLDEFALVFNHLIDHLIKTR